MSMSPTITWDDPRCTPQDTFATWFLKNRWPALLADPTPYGGKTPWTFAQRWEATLATLTIADPTPYRCKTCGTHHSPDNPLLWGNLDTAKAHGWRGLNKINNCMIYAQDTTITSGDTDMTLIGHHATAPMVYCLACTLVLSTRVMNYAMGQGNQAFWWTPQQEAIPWANPGALWELPFERPLIFRAAPGTGKNNEK
ncbi:MAG: hypothetical protein ACYCOU_26865, partial [Sulfobacillus sp.]